MPMRSAPSNPRGMSASLNRIWLCLDQAPFCFRGRSTDSCFAFTPRPHRDREEELLKETKVGRTEERPREKDGRTNKEGGRDIERDAKSGFSGGGGGDRSGETPIRN